MKRLAFLFLIYDEINHEDIWWRFFQGVDITKYKVLVHYKYQKPLRYFENCKIKNCVSTEYADISICAATQLLYQEALKDDHVFKLILVSQSCVPLKSFDYVYEELCADEFSKFNKSNSCVLKHIKNAPDILNRNEVLKTSQWSILHRFDAQICAEDTEYRELFKDCYAPDEYLFSTILNRYVAQNLVLTDDLTEGATTFTNWKGRPYRFPNETFNELKNYDNISLRELNYLIQSPCLFGRKFNKECLVDLQSPLLDVLVDKLFN